MITANINGRTINIVWNYNPVVNRQLNKTLVHTTCILRDDTVKGNIIEITVGTAHQSVHDIHCKEKARKVSLARALQNAEFNREQRETVWNAYLNRPRPKNAEQAKSKNEKISLQTVESPMSVV